MSLEVKLLKCEHLKPGTLGTGDQADAFVEFEVEGNKQHSTTICGTCCPEWHPPQEFTFPQVDKPLQLQVRVVDANQGKNEQLGMAPLCRRGGGRYVEQPFDAICD